MSELEESSSRQGEPAVPTGAFESDPSVGRSSDGAPARPGRGISPPLSAKISNVTFAMVFLVVIIHSQTRPKSSSLAGAGPLEWASSFAQLTVSEGFARVAVPLYFAISGFLFFQGYAWRAGFFRKKFATRLASLVVPYAAWSGFWMLAYSALQYFPRTRPYCQTTIIGDMTPLEALRTWTLDPIPVQLWYLRDLILLCLLTPLLGPAIGRFPATVLLACLLAWFLDVVLLPEIPVHMTVLSVEGLLFFSAGGAIALRGSPAKVEMPILVPIAWVALCLAHAGLDLIDPLGHWNLPLHRLSILLGVWSVWGGYDRIREAGIRPSSPAWAAVSSYGTFIFLAHVPLITFTNKRLIAMIKSPWSPLLTYVLGFLLTSLLCLAAGILLKRAAPRFYSILTGGR